MTVNKEYELLEPRREEIDVLPGPVVIEFGAPWCGYCRAAQVHIAAAFNNHPGVRHIKIEDGSGRRLGRSFGVKLWPTLIFMLQGKELARLVRPDDTQTIAKALAEIDR